MTETPAGICASCGKSMRYNSYAKKWICDNCQISRDDTPKQGEILLPRLSKVDDSSDYRQNGHGEVTPLQSRAETPFYRRDSVVSKQVYDANARLVGTVRDIGYAEDGQAALLVEAQGQETWLRFSDVAHTGDIILLKREAATTERNGTVIF